MMSGTKVHRQYCNTTKFRNKKYIKTDDLINFYGTNFVKDINICILYISYSAIFIN